MLLAYLAAGVGAELPALPWPTLGAGGLLGLAVLLVLTGRLVPRSVLRDAQAERDAWRQAAMAALQQNGKLMVGAEVSWDVLQAIPAARKGEPADHQDPA